MKTLSMPLDKYFKIIKPTYIYLKVIPHKSNRNNSSSNLAKTIASIFKTTKERIEKIEKRYIYKTNWKCAYMIDLKKTNINDVSFYFIVPSHYKNLIKDKIKQVWNKSDIEELYEIQPFERDCIKYQLTYKKEDSLSLKIDKSSNEPLNSILNVLDIMESGDRVSIIYNFNYYNQMLFENKHTKDIRLFKEHKNLDKQRNLEYYLKSIGTIAVELVTMFLNVFADLFSSEKSIQRDLSFLEAVTDIINQNKSSLSAATNNKTNKPVLKTQIAVLSESTSKNRKLTNALSVCQSYRNLEEDNSLIYKPLKSNFNITDRFISNAKKNIIGVDECQNFLQSPGRELLNTYNIKHTKVIENPLPLELMNGTKYLGQVKYKESQYDAFLEDEYNIGNLPLIQIGAQGGGKTTFMANYAKCCNKVNEGVIVIDFIKNCELSNAIKTVVNKSDLIELDLSLEDNLQGLGYNEIEINDNMSNYDKLKYANLQTQQLMNFIDSIGCGDELTRRMRRFLSAAATVVFVQKCNSIKNVIECLEDHTKRVEYIKNLEDDIKQYLEDDIKSLNELNEYSKPTKDNSVVEIIGTKESKIEHILDRVAILREDFKLKYMYNKNLDNNINLVKAMDDGKVVLIKIKQSEFQGKVAKNVLVTYWLTKVWLASQLRGAKSEKPLRCNLIIDEIWQAPTSLNLLEYILPQSRKFGCKFILSTQYTEQLDRIFSTLDASGASYMMFKGCLEKDFNYFKNKIDNFEYEDLKEMPQWHSMNLIYYSKGYSSFISHLPNPIKTI